MDSVKIIKKFKDLYDLHETEIYMCKQKGQQSFYLDFTKVSTFNHKLAELLLDEPVETIKAAEIALEQFEEINDMKARFLNLPPSSHVTVNNLRSHHIGKMIYIDGTCKQTSTVKSVICSSKYECPNCGNIITFLQVGDEEIFEPRLCGCGRRGKFRLLGHEYDNVQGVNVQELFETLEDGQQPGNINVVLSDDLTDPKNQYKLLSGRRVKINGVVKIKHLKTKQGSGLKTVERYISANTIESFEEKQSILINEEDKKEIISFSKKETLIPLLIKSFAPTIHGVDEIKLGIILSMVGGVTIKDIRKRGDIHVMIAGVPGKGKTRLLLAGKDVMPKSRKVSGKGASGPGLTAAVVKDEFLGGWTLEAGALVLANKNICWLDELDKVGSEDRGFLHEVMEEQTITIDKVIHAKLRAETTIIAACNPKNAMFDDYQLDFSAQLNMPNSLINRFDLLFKITDTSNVEKDKERALKKFKEMKEVNPPLTLSFLQKYIQSARKFENPTWNEEAQIEVAKWYSEIRSNYNKEVIPINDRQLDGILRLSEAYAKLHRSIIITKDHVISVISLLKFSLAQIGAIDSSILKNELNSTEIKILRRFEKEGDFKLEDIRDDFRGLDDLLFKSLEKLVKLKYLTNIGATGYKLEKR